jgi:hypothetical protein
MRRSINLIISFFGSFILTYASLFKGNDCLKVMVQVFFSVDRKLIYAYWYFYQIKKNRFVMMINSSFNIVYYTTHYHCLKVTLHVSILEHLNIKQFFFFFIYPNQSLGWIVYPNITFFFSLKFTFLFFFFFLVSLLNNSGK